MSFDLSADDQLLGKDERQEILRSLPQTPPFRFIDEILQLSLTHIKATYLFTGQEWFYQGHFLGDPITPGVILIEAMAQAGLVALGMNLIRSEGQNQRIRTLFSECSVEFHNIVRPGERIFITGQRKYWRKNKLRTEVELRNAEESLIANGDLSGLGVIL